MKNIVPSQGGAGGDQPSYFNVKYGRVVAWVGRY